MIPAKEILDTTWSAVVASLSVILVLVYGYMARRHKLVSPEGESSISTLCTTIFLPCLLFSEIGPLATWANIKDYWVIIVYSILFQLVSYVFGAIGVYVFKMPQWLIPCMVFNNATSLPLLLLNTLGDMGTLDPLLRADDSLSSALSRGRVYLLINALVCNLTRFTFGPAMMADHPAHLPHPWSHSESPHAPLAARIKDALPTLPTPPSPTMPYPHVEPYHPTSEHTPLVQQARDKARRGWTTVKWVEKGVAAFVNPPMLGGMAAIVAGVIPFTHDWLFNEGAWLSPLSQSIDNLGSLYAALQMFVLGAHLRSKKGSRPPIATLLYLFLFRFAVMPVISTSVIYGVRLWLKDAVLQDPILASFSSQWRVMLGTDGRTLSWRSRQSGRPL